MGALGWRKFAAVFAIYFQDALAYRVSGLIWVLTDVVQVMVLPLVMHAAAKGGEIGGYTGGQLVAYYLASMLLGGFITCYFMFDVAFEIKEGRFTTVLVRPMSFFQVCVARNLSWRFMRLSLTLPFFLLFLFLYRGYLDGAGFHVSPELIVSVILGHFVSFTISMALAMVALYVGDAMGIFELYFFPQLFLSGQVFPIGVLPDWAQRISHALPFYSTLGLPSEIMVGKVAPSAAWPAIGVQALWAVGGYIAWRALYVNGLKHYTGVGM